MFVFIDESGDPGFKFDCGSSPLFVVALVLFDSAGACDAVRERIRAAKRRLGYKSEFKFSKTRPEAKDHFFESFAGCAFEVRGLVVRKTSLPIQPALLKKQTFYDHFLKCAIQLCGADIGTAQVVVDGAADRTLRDRLKVALSAGAGPCPRTLARRDSQAEELVQLADMAAGAIARGHRPDDRDSRWLKFLERQSQLGPIHVL